MKRILPHHISAGHIIPLNVVYHYKINDRNEDQIVIILKELMSGELRLHEITNPTIDMYIVKPEHRKFHHMRDYIEKDMCDVYEVRYKYRWREASKILGLAPGDDAKKSPYVFGIDIPLETYYLMKVISENPTEYHLELNHGCLDIENDYINVYGGIAESGTTPINAVSYVNNSMDTVFAFILVKDNIMMPSKGTAYYEYYTYLRENFKKEKAKIEKSTQEVIDLCKDKFTDLYGEMTYDIQLFEDEIELLRAVFSTMHEYPSDYVGIWNLPYDISNIIDRIKFLMHNPEDIICHSGFSSKIIDFREDTNPVAHRRRHTCITSSLFTFVDDMVNYAGIRSVGSKIPSLRLGAIAQTELKDDKYDFSEVSDLRYLYYEDICKFIVYNIKDTLLLRGISKTTDDIYNVHSRMMDMSVLFKEAFTTTKVVWNSLIPFIDERGYIFASNRNSGNNIKKLFTYNDIAKLFPELVNALDFDNIHTEEFDSDMLEFDDDWLDDETADESDDDDKEKKFEGAYVSNPLYIQPTGVEINGTPSKYVHDDVADSDVTAEYPTAVVIQNGSNDTLIGRVFLAKPSQVNIPIPDDFIFVGKTRDKYRLDPSKHMMELYAQGDIIDIATYVLNLPSADEILDDIAILLSDEE